ncbi:helix-turn-helix domain-containing protein [Mucilaginibacter paludis]|uniref:Helix-turn-helix, AraC domain-containing protein n=1 Tax=Mucilaginibacter paludis DSM 18603 TaxID=714943 RepID=H1Y353_9SPHI|nr:helix-turn-helix domain-containing protein [Mucilaginibacter paludis]EHQ28871.1 Helix-turn-helix, AraC domain-containing protein [Mucilaginibacter paludis DSM 18603]
MPINFFKHLADQNGDHILRIAPPEHLKEVVEGFYVCKAGYPEERELFFNDGYPVIALMQNKDENFSVNIDGHTKYVGNAWVCGGVLRNIYCEFERRFEDCLVIRFNAVTFFKLFDINEDSFQNRQVFDFTEIAGYGIEKFKEAYYSCTALEDRVKVIVDFLSGKMTVYSYPKLLIDIQNYIEREGILTVKDILDGYSVRLNYKWLERNFKKHLGISPQSYLLMRRFLNAYLDLDALTSKDLLEIAIDNGYYDDNHLIKDFRRFSGVTPKTYFNVPARVFNKAIDTVAL